MGCCKHPEHGCEFDPNSEAPSADDVARFGGEDIECPNCGSDVYHDAALCHTCGHAMEHAPTGQPKPWVMLTAGVVIVAFVLVFAL